MSISEFRHGDPFPKSFLAGEDGGLELKGTILTVDL